MNFLDRDEMVALAGEYALGVLPPEDNAAFERELAHNRELGSARASWHDRLLAVAPTPNAVEPAVDLWQRIERCLPRKRAVRTRRVLWDNLWFWRAGGIAGLALSLMLALRLLTALPDTAPPQYVAVLQAADSGISWLVEINTKAVHLRPLGRPAIAPGRAIQFWTKPEGAAAPTSLGLVQADRPTTVALDKLPGISPNQLFEVTLEASTGSPTGRPTGPILAVGKAVRL